MAETKRPRDVRLIAMSWPKRSRRSVAERLAICSDRIERIRPKSLDILCFPESFLHAGLTYQHISEVHPHYLPAIALARQWAAHLRSYVVLPVIHAHRGTYTNSTLTFSRSGSLIG